MQSELKRKSTQKTVRKILSAAVADLIQPAENTAVLISLRNKMRKTAVMEEKKTIKRTNVNGDVCCLYLAMDNINYGTQEDELLIRVVCV